MERWMGGGSCGVDGVPVVCFMVISFSSRSLARKISARGITAQSMSRTGGALEC